MNRSLVGQLAAIPLFLVLAVGSSPKKKGEETSASSTTSTAGAVGRAVLVGDAEWTVTEVVNRGSVLTGNESYTKELRTAGQYIEVHFKVKNVGNTEGNFGFTDIKVIDPTKREFGTVEMASLYRSRDTPGIVMEKVQASMTKEFAELFEIPPGVTRLSLRASDFGSFGSKKEIDLGTLPAPAAKPAASASVAAAKAPPAPPTPKAAAPARTASVTPPTPPAPTQSAAPAPPAPAPKPSASTKPKK